MPGEREEGRRGGRRGRKRWRRGGKYREEEEKGEGEVEEVGRQQAGGRRRGRTVAGTSLCFLGTFRE